MDFANIISQIWEGIKSTINTILNLPNFILNLINILPADLRLPFTLVIAVIVILLIYRFIR
mgnify:CR=1 FL=1